jgi:hypothetical protein
MIRWERRKGNGPNEGPLIQPVGRRWRVLGPQPYLLDPRRFRKCASQPTVVFSGSAMVQSYLHDRAEFVGLLDVQLQTHISLVVPSLIEEADRGSTRSRLFLCSPPVVCSMHSRTRCALRYSPVLPVLSGHEANQHHRLLGSRPRTRAGQNRNDSCGPAPDVVFRIRRSHGRGMRDRRPGIEATLRLPRGWFCALGYLVPGGTDICPPLMIDKTTPGVR